MAECDSALSETDDLTLYLICQIWALPIQKQTSILKVLHGNDYNNQIIVSPFVHIFDIISLFAVEFEEPKTGISGKGFIYYLQIQSKFHCLVNS